MFRSDQTEKAPQKRLFEDGTWTLPVASRKDEGGITIILTSLTASNTFFSGSVHSLLQGILWELISGQEQWLEKIWKRHNKAFFEDYQQYPYYRLENNI